MNDSIPDFLVEQLALGELPEATAARIRARLEAEKDPRLADIERSNAETLHAYPASMIAGRIRGRVRQSQPGSPWLVWSVAGVAVAAAAIGLVLLWPDADPSSQPTSGQDRVARVDRDTVRIKGDPKILIHRERGTKAELLLDGDVVDPGDVINVGYAAEGRTHGVLLSIDGRGEVTLHFPRDPSAPTKLSDTRVLGLHSFELDDAPAFERFVFVTSDTAIDVEAVTAAARALANPRSAPLDLPGVGQKDLLLRKP